MSALTSSMMAFSLPSLLDNLTSNAKFKESNEKSGIKVFEDEFAVSKGANIKSVRMTGSPAGVYLLELRNEEERLVRKVLITE